MPLANDLTFRVSVLDDGRLWAAVSGPGGQEDDYLLPFDDAELAEQIRLLRIQMLDAEAQMALGHRLFDALFPPSLRRIYQGSLEVDGGLRLVLTYPPEAAAFAALPWEYLTDPERGPLVQRRVSIVRYLAQPAALPVLNVALPLRVLLTGAQTPPEADVKAELRAARDALKKLGDQVSTTIESSLTLGKLRAQLRNGYHIWHFVGHGGAGTLFFEDDLGDTTPVDADVLAATLAESDVRLVVLSACQGGAVGEDVLQGLAPALVAAGVPAVVAMQFMVAEESTRAFTTELYQAMAHGLPIDRCVAAGRTALLATTGAARPDWGIPVVYTRAADGILFTLPQANPVAPPDLLALAVAKLSRLPLDHLPEAEILPAGSRMPFGRNPLFVGRSKDLGLAASALMAESAALPTAAITGMAGVGKTSLAIEFAHRYGQFFDGGVFWVRCPDPHAIAAEIAACGGPDGLDIPGWTEMKIEEQVERVKQAWEDPLPRLLIFDGCEDEEVLGAWRPASGGCRLILTSIRSNWSAALGIQQIALEVLARQESVDLLRKYRPDLAENDPVLAALAEELGDLPLALRLAGSYLETYRNDPRLGAPSALIEELRGPGLLEHEALRGLELAETELSVGRAFALSFSQLDQTDSVDSIAIALLTRAACLAPGVQISRELLVSTVLPDEQAGSILEQAGQLLKGLSALWGAKPAPPSPNPERLAGRALVRLVTLGLLEQEAGGALSIHRLIAAFARQAMPDLSAQVAVERALVRRLMEITDKAGFVSSVGDVLPHLLVVANHAMPRGDSMSAGMANLAGHVLFQIGSYKLAAHYYDQSVALQTKVEGPEDPLTATALANKGLALQSQGDLGGARQAIEQALAIKMKRFGPDHVETANTLNFLGIVLHSQGDLMAARQAHEQALAIRERLLGSEHADTAMSLNNLGSILQSQGQLAAARPYLEQALAIQQKVHGLEHTVTAMSLHNLGVLLSWLHDLAGAQQAHAQALAIRQKLLGPEHPDTAMSLSELGNVLYSMNDLEGARPFLEQSLNLWVQLLGSEHPYVASGLNSLGNLLDRQGDFVGAQQCYERALRIRERVFGSDHPETAIILNNLGYLSQKQGQIEAAQTFLERALAIFERAFGPEHPQVATCLTNFGQFFEAQGNLASALASYERALAIQEKILGPDHPETARALNNLGMLLINQGDTANAHQYYERALLSLERGTGLNHELTSTVVGNLLQLLTAEHDLQGIKQLYDRLLAHQRQALGPDHLDLASVLCDVGLQLMSLGDYGSARPYLEEALAIHEKVLGPGDAKTGDNLGLLGIAMYPLGDAASGRSYMERALAVLEKAHGPDHPETAMALFSFSSVLCQWGDLPLARTYLERALAIREQGFGPDHPITAESIAAMGHLLRCEGNPAEARAYFERALQVYLANHGEDHEDVKAIRNALAELGETATPERKKERKKAGAVSKTK